MQENFDVDIFLERMSHVFEMHITKFPGALPISLTRDMLQKICFGYIFTLKADGVRNFVIVSGSTGNVYLLQRNLVVQYVGCFDFSKKYNIKKDAWFVFDAEVCKNRIFIVDTIVFNSLKCTTYEINTRMELAKFFLQKLAQDSTLLNQNEPQFRLAVASCYAFTKVYLRANEKTNFIQKKDEEKKEELNFELQCKPMYGYDHLEKMWSDEVKSKLDFLVDGIIFIRRCSSYVAFRGDPESLIKWKPLNTVDFFCVAKNEENFFPKASFQKQLEYDEHEVIKQFREQEVSETNVAFFSSDNVFVTFSKVPSKKVLLYHKKVVECYWNHEHCYWVTKLCRHDKDQANSIDTILKTCLSIRDNISLAQLIDFTHV